MDEIQKELIRNNLSPLICESYENLGFISDDGIRYFRRKNNLVHFIVFSVEELSKQRHGTRSDGNHLSYLFGEFLTHTPSLAVMSSETIKVSVSCEVTNPIAFVNKKHFKNASEKVIKALTQIDTDRFTQVSTELDYEDFHLRGGPSLEKIYHLTSEGRHEEVDAWLKLMTHQYRGFRCTKSYSDDKALNYYFDNPSSEEVSFSKLSVKERIEFIDDLRSLNITKNSLGYLYETV